MPFPGKILIVGGGIGGLALALSLIRRGIDVEVYEQAPELREVGAGVQIGPNGVHVLQAGFQQFSLVGGAGDPNWKIKGTADINQDGRSDVLFQNINNGNVVEWLMNGATNVTQTGVVPNTSDAAWQLIGVA